MGIVDLKKKYELKDIVKGDSIFCATGITNGELVKGIEKFDDYFMTDTFVTHKSNNITMEKGLNRFSWDMRHRGSWDDNDERSFRFGPMVSPGEYVIKLDIDGEVYSKNFKILEDPRISDMSIKDYQEQESLLLDIRDFVTELKLFKTSLDEKMRESNNDTYERIYNLLVTKSGTYMQPMLIDQARYLPVSYTHLTLPTITEV